MPCKRDNPVVPFMLFTTSGGVSYSVNTLPATGVQRFSLDRRRFCFLLGVGALGMRLPVTCPAQAAPASWNESVVIDRVLIAGRHGRSLAIQFDSWARMFVRESWDGQKSWTAWYPVKPWALSSTAT